MKTKTTFYHYKQKRKKVLATKLIKIRNSKVLIKLVSYPKGYYTKDKSIRVYATIMKNGNN